MDHNWGYATAMLSTVRHEELIAEAERYRRLKELGLDLAPRHGAWAHARGRLASALNRRAATSRSGRHAAWATGSVDTGTVSPAR